MLSSDPIAFAKRSALSFGPHNSQFLQFRSLAHLTFAVRNGRLARVYFRELCIRMFNLYHFIFIMEHAPPINRSSLSHTSAHQVNSSYCSGWTSVVSIRVLWCAKSRPRTERAGALCAGGTGDKINYACDDKIELNQLISPLRVRHTQRNCHSSPIVSLLRSVASFNPLQVEPTVAFRQSPHQTYNTILKLLSPSSACSAHPTYNIICALANAAAGFSNTVRTSVCNSQYALINKPYSPFGDKSYARILIHVTSYRAYSSGQNVTACVPLTAKRTNK